MLDKIDEFIFSFEEIESITLTNEYVNMIDIEIEDDSSFLLANNIISHNSATASIMKVLGRNGFAYFSLRGKPLNVLKATTSKITGNKEITHITQILNLNLTDSQTDMNFENVLIATDADLDGILIRGLILTIFNKFAPQLIKDGRIKILTTPMITAVKKDVIKEYFLSFDEYLKFQKKNKNYDYNFYKGLGTWRGKSDLGKLFDDYGLDTFIDSFEEDEGYEKVLRSWMAGGDVKSDERKAYLRNKEFDIFKM